MDVVKCPNCSEELLKSKERYVCINCGYSRPLKDVNPVADETKRGLAAPSVAAVVVAAPSPLANHAHKPPPLPPPRPPAPPPAEVVVVNKAAVNKVKLKRHLTKVMGEGRYQRTEQSLSGAKKISQDFVVDYKTELNELLNGPVGRYLRIVGALLIVMACAGLVFTFLL